MLSSDTNLHRILNNVIREFPRNVQRIGCRDGYQKDLWILKTLDPLLRSPCAVLDVGAGSGVVSQCLVEMGHSVCAVDTWAEYSAKLENRMGIESDIVGRLARKRINCIHANIISDPWPVADESFDVVILSEVIEHIPQSPKELLGKIWRSLKPGGTLLITTPNHARLVKRLALLAGRSAHAALQNWWTEVPFYGHVREYTPKEVEFMMGSSGFEKIRTRISNRPMWHGIYGRSLISQALVFVYLGVSGLWPNWRARMLVTGQRPRNRRNPE